MVLAIPAHDIVDPLFYDLSGGSDANGREPMGEQTALIVKRPKRKEKGMDHSLLLEHAADALKTPRLVPFSKGSINSQQHQPGTKPLASEYWTTSMFKPLQQGLHVWNITHTIVSGAHLGVIVLLPAFYRMELSLTPIQVLVKLGNTMCVHVCACAYVCMCVNMCVFVYMCIYLHACMRARVYM